MFNEHCKSFHDLPVAMFEPDKGIVDTNTAYRIQVDWKQNETGITFKNVFDKLREDPRSPELRALILGDWGETSDDNDCKPIVEELVAARDDLTSLEALFVGDITEEECRICWIQLTDLSPLYAAFPRLAELRVRGRMHLSFGELNLPDLRRLVVETDCMPRKIIQQVCHANLPELHHLELWLGDIGYGEDFPLDDLRPVLAGNLFPNLKCLGLRNCSEADLLARIVAKAAILKRIDVLDLSPSHLSNNGAEVLATSQFVPWLKRLDIRHHYVTEKFLIKLRELDINVDARDRLQPDRWEDTDDYHYDAITE